MPRSPEAAQLELTVRLRRRRAQLGLPIREVSKYLEFSSNYYSAVENGRTLLAADKLERLCERLEFSAQDTDELRQLRELAREHRWTADYSPVINETMAQYIGLEWAASTIRSHEGRVIPGLLQTPDYISALLRDDPDIPGTRAQQRIDLRQRRQQRLFDQESPLRLQVVVSQSVVMQQVGGRDVLRTQLQHIVNLMDQLPNLDFRVVPFDVSPRGMINNATAHILEFPSQHLPMLVWREDLIPIGVSDEPDIIDVFVVNHERTTASALNRHDTQAFLLKRIQELGSDPGKSG